VTAMLGVAVALAFDMTSVMMLMYPGRERVEVASLDGTTVIYACKTGPDGETPEMQARKAQEAFETNLGKFAEALVGGMMEDVAENKPALSTGLSVHLKTQSWAGAIVTHLEKDYGCLLLG
jgi:hypothetical protein